VIHQYPRERGDGAQQQVIKGKYLFERDGSGGEKNRANLSWTSVGENEELSGRMKDLLRRNERGENQIFKGAREKRGTHVAEGWLLKKGNTTGIALARNRNQSPS